MTVMTMMTICYRFTNMIEHNLSDSHWGYKSTGQVTTMDENLRVRQRLIQIAAQLTVLHHVLCSQCNFKYFNSINTIKGRIWSIIFTERLMETWKIQTAWKVNGAEILLICFRKMISNLYCKILLKVACGSNRKSYIVLQFLKIKVEPLQPHHWTLKGYWENCTLAM